MSDGGGPTGSWILRRSLGIQLDGGIGGGPLRVSFLLDGPEIFIIDCSMYVPRILVRLEEEVRCGVV